MPDQVARKAAQQDELLGELDFLAREYDNYDYGLPLGEGNLEQMRAVIDKYDTVRLAPIREALQAIVDDAEEHGYWSQAANISDVGAGECLSVRSGCDDLYPEVNPEEIIHFLNRRIFYVAYWGEVELSSVINQFALAQLRSHEFFLAGAALVAEFPATVDRPNAYVLTLIVPEDVAVIGKCSAPSESGLLGLVDRIGIRNLAVSSNHYFGPKCELGSCFGIAKSVELVDAEGLSFPCLLADPVATIVRPLQGFEEIGLGTVARNQL